MKKIIVSVIIALLAICSPNKTKCQGMNSHFLLGYSNALFDTNVVSTKAVLKFDSLSYTLTPDSFKMAFRAAQGNLSDDNGNLLMVSNGCWIADATGDTMQNGAGLLPNGFSASWCGSNVGIPYPHSSVFIPHPTDSNLVYLIHQSGTSASNYRSSGLYFTLIDKTLNNGLGGVVAGQKNQLIFSTSLNPYICVCKHANGRDWWISVIRDSTDQILTTCLSPSGFSTSIIHTSGFSPPPLNFDGQINFSPDGKKIAYSYCKFNGINYSYYVRILDFNRCSGVFSNPLQISFTDQDIGLGLAFSPNSNLLYVSSVNKIYQYNLYASNISASKDTVAINDGYYSPYPPFQTDFWVMTLAPNGKIYISSGNGVIDLHYINYPDSVGVACDVQQHAIHLPCFSGRGHVYHPNYYLGCDTTLGCPCLVTTGLAESGGHDFKAKLSPNPGHEGFEILYLLPQSKSGTLQIYDMQGRLIHKQDLPQWSTLQNVYTANWPPGVYQVRIISAAESGVWKWVKL